MNVVLQERDHQLLRSLAFAVRLLTVQQVAWLRYADVANTRKRMARLEASGFVAPVRIVAQPPPPVETPLCRWSPGQPLPNPGKLSYAAKKRYDRRIPRAMTAYVATNRTLSVFGISAPKLAAKRAVVRFKQHQATHDVGLAEVFVKHHWPQSAWVGEDIFAADRGWGEKVEDALILGPDRDLQRPLLAVDYISKYPPHRIEALAHALAERELPFAFF